VGSEFVIEDHICGAHAYNTQKRRNERNAVQFLIDQGVITQEESSTVIVFCVNWNVLQIQCDSYQRLLGTIKGQKLAIYSDAEYIREGYLNKMADMARKAGATCVWVIVGKITSN
jgi:phage terminase small subunit